MKNLSLIVMLMMFSGLFLTSCEKEFESNPLPGNSQDNILKDGEAGSDDGLDTDDDDSDDGITDGGRDEDYDKSGKKKPKP